MSARIVVSVGTSLLTNNQKSIQTHFGTLKESLEQYRSGAEKLTGIDFLFDDNALTNITPNEVVNELKGILGFSKKFFELYLNEKIFQKNINIRKIGGIDSLPAEISSLFLYYYDADGNLRTEFEERLDENTDGEFNDKDEIILLTTDTADAVYCAGMLKMILKKVGLFNKRCKIENDVQIIRNLDVFNPEKWANRDYIRGKDQSPESDKGLTNLLNWFDTHFNSTTEGNRIMIRTGGYKEFSADLKLMCIKYGFTSFYLFERSVHAVVTYMGQWNECDIKSIINGTRFRP